MCRTYGPPKNGSIITSSSCLALGKRGPVIKLRYNGIYRGITSYNFQIKSFVLKIAFFLVNSEDPDEMSPYATIHLDLHCLSKCSFRCHQDTKRVHGCVSQSD